MYETEIAALLAFEKVGDPAIAGLAAVLLDLVAALRDADQRADLADAKYEAAHDQITTLRALVRDMFAAADDPSRDKILGDIARFVRTDSFSL